MFSPACFQLTSVKLHSDESILAAPLVLLFSICIVSRAVVALAFSMQKQLAVSDDIFLLS